MGDMLQGGDAPEEFATPLADPGVSPPQLLAAALSRNRPK